MKYLWACLPHELGGVNGRVFGLSPYEAKLRADRGSKFVDLASNDVRVYPATFGARSPEFTLERLDLRARRRGGRGGRTRRLLRGRA
jgi:hypothetical protein